MEENAGRFRSGHIPWNKGKQFYQIAGASHPNWKGGRFKSSAGYVFVKSDHPRSNRHGYMFEHILFAEQKIGRKLNDNESVHHINGIRDDNRLDNLIVLTKSQHASIHMTKHDKHPHINKRELEEQYLGGKSIRQIAEDSNSTVMNIVSQLKENNIVIKHRGYKKRNVPPCGFVSGSDHPNWKGGISKDKAVYLKEWRHRKGMSKKYQIRKDKQKNVRIIRWNRCCIVKDSQLAT
jgi:hypothetical protein